MNNFNLMCEYAQNMRNSLGPGGIKMNDKPLKNDSTNPLLTLPTDSAERKNYPLLNGCLKYFPAALAGIALISKLGNDKHNPGQPLHHARNKSTDHGDCIIRHLIDTEDLLAAQRRGSLSVTKEMILTEASQLAWRALAYSQALQEELGAPLAPGAKEDCLASTQATIIIPAGTMVGSINDFVPVATPEFKVGVCE